MSHGTLSSQHTTENKNASDIDDWLGGDFNRPHT
jgi:hypothetical protein